MAEKKVQDSALGQKQGSQFRGSPLVSDWVAPIERIHRRGYIHGEELVIDKRAARATPKCHSVERRLERIVCLALRALSTPIHSIMALPLW